MKRRSPPRGIIAMVGRGIIIITIIIIIPRTERDKLTSANRQGAYRYV